jgi:hypothetical protein
VFVVLFADYVPMPFTTLLLVALVAWYLLESRLFIPRPMLRLVWIPGLLVLLGISGFLNNQSREVMKDVWYFSKYPLVIGFGYLWARGSPSIRQTLRGFMVVTGVASAIYLAAVLSGQDPLHVSLGPLTAQYGRGPSAAILGAAIIPTVGLYRFQLRDLRFGIRMLILLFSILCLTLAGSRTLIVSTLILLAGLFFHRLTRQAKVLFLGLSVLSALFITQWVVRQAATAEWGSLVSRTAISVQELTPKTHREAEDIGHFWRAHETAMTWSFYLQGQSHERLIGRGFGALIDIGGMMNFKGLKYRYIPKLHNGYLYILVKTGLVGLLLHAIFLGLFVNVGLRNVNAGDPERRFAAMLLILLVLNLLFVTWFVSGLFSKQGLFPATVLMGALLAHLDRPISDRRIPRGSPGQPVAVT